MEEVFENEMKFCPTCGYEGADELCPVCNEKMASLKAEVDRVAEIEEAKDVTETGDVSLEEAAQKEESESEFVDVQ